MKAIAGGYKDLIPLPHVTTFLNNRHTDIDRLISHLPDWPVWDMHQTHTANVAYIDRVSSRRQAHNERGVDAMFTTEKQVFLKVRTADCLPILIYHPKPAIAAIHAGRRGTDAGILADTLQKMSKTLGISDGFHLWFGPAICVNCYEIQREPSRHYDLIAENKAQILETLSPTAVTLYESDRCTACSNEEFFSYRREGPRSGRVYSVIAIR